MLDKIRIPEDFQIDLLDSSYSSIRCNIKLDQINSNQTNPIILKIYPKVNIHRTFFRGFRDGYDENVRTKYIVIANSRISLFNKIHKKYFHWYGIKRTKIFHILKQIYPQSAKKNSIITPFTNSWILKEVFGYISAGSFQQVLCLPNSTTEPVVIILTPIQLQPNNTEEAAS